MSVIILENEEFDNFTDVEYTNTENEDNSELDNFDINDM